MRIVIELDTGAHPDDAAILRVIATALAGQSAATVAATPRAPAAPRDPADLAEQLIAVAERNRGAPPVDAEDDEPASGTPGEALPPFDASGVPHDARIHATPASITKGDGMWRKKRKVDEVTFGQVHAELSHANFAAFEAWKAGNPPAPANPTGTGSTGTESPAVGIATPRPAPPPPADTPVVPNGDGAAGNAPPPPPTVAGNAPTAPGSSAVPAVSAVSEPAPPPADTPSAGRFATFPQFVAALQAVKTPPFPFDKLNSFAQSVGVEKFADMHKRPDAWELFYALAEESAFLPGA